MWDGKEGVAQNRKREIKQTVLLYSILFVNKYISCLLFILLIEYNIRWIHPLTLISKWNTIRFTISTHWWRGFLVICCPFKQTTDGSQSSFASNTDSAASAPKRVAYNKLKHSISWLCTVYVSQYYSRKTYQFFFVTKKNCYKQ